MISTIHTVPNIIPLQSDFYKEYKSIEFQNLCSLDLKNIGIACSLALESQFCKTKRHGALLYEKGKCVLRA